MNAQGQELVQSARDALARAYAPYSGFAVAAALLAKDGSIHVGVNVENVSFGLSLCAERSAVVAAVARGAREFEQLVIVSSSGAPTAPCGACRQVLHEFSPRLRIRLIGSDAEREHLLCDLLPNAFSSFASE